MFLIYVEIKIYKYVYRFRIPSIHEINAQKYTVQPADKNGMKNWMPDSLKYGYVDFRAFLKKEIKPSEYFIMKGLGHRFGFALWTKMYDGLFYIRAMYPCEVSN